jgi:opacity protein-like surface antigen
MKKVLLIAALAVSSVSFAQDNSSDKPLSFSVGAELGLPIGDAAVGSSFVGGFSAQLDYNVASQVALTLNSGYGKFFGKDGSDGFGVIPVLGGLKYSFNDQFYGSAQLGLSFLTFGGESTSGFTFAPGVGYKVSDKFDVLLKYTNISDNDGAIGVFGTRLSYNF